MSKNDQERKCKIVAAGDVCMDVLTAPITAQRKQDDPSENWRLSGGNRTFSVCGRTAGYDFGGSIRTYRKCL